MVTSPRALGLCSTGARDVLSDCDGAASSCATARELSCVGSCSIEEGVQSGAGSSTGGRDCGTRRPVLLVPRADGGASRRVHCYPISPSLPSVVLGRRLEPPRDWLPLKQSLLLIFPGTDSAGMQADSAVASLSCRVDAFDELCCLSHLRHRPVLWRYIQRKMRITSTTTAGSSGYSVPRLSDPPE